MTEELDWRDMFYRYTGTVGEAEGVDFLQEARWSDQEWDAIWDLHLERGDPPEWVANRRQSRRREA